MDHLTLMWRKSILVAVILLSFTMSWLGKRLLAGPELAGPRAAGAAGAPGRMVSLAPSITETVYALGLGGRLVGDTRFCDYPEDAKTKARVGGYFDANYEAIVALRPDLVIILKENETAKKFLDALGLRVLVVDHRSVAGIIESVREIGREGGAEDRARELTAEMSERIETVKARVAGRPRPRVLISVGRDFGSGGLREIYISGGDGYFNDLVEIAGGVNAYRGNTIPFPRGSVETILRLNPEVVVEIAPRLSAMDLTPQQVIKEWDTAADIEAVKNGRVQVLTGEYVAVPGPRFPQTLMDLARVIHPEVDWDQ